MALFGKKKDAGGSQGAAAPAAEFYPTQNSGGTAAGSGDQSTLSSFVNELEGDDSESKRKGRKSRGGKSKDTAKKDASPTPTIVVKKIRRRRKPKPTRTPDEIKAALKDAVEKSQSYLKGESDTPPIQEFDDLAELGNHSAGFVYLKGKAYQKAAMAEEDKVTKKALLTRAVNSYLRATSLYGQSNKEEDRKKALKAARKAYEIAPKYGPVKIAMAYAYIVNGETKQAQRISAHELESPESGPVADMHTECILAHHANSAAGEAFSQAAPGEESAPDDDGTTNEGNDDDIVPLADESPSSSPGGGDSPADGVAGGP